MLSLAVCSAVTLLGSRSQDAGTQPKPDRSGEPELKRLMDSSASLRNVRFHLSIVARDSREGVMYPDCDIDVRFLGPGKYRMEVMDPWGDGYTLVSDGATLMR